MLDNINIPVVISIVIYVAILSIIFLSNASNVVGKEKQMLFYYIISIIVPILIYVFVISFLL